MTDSSALALSGNAAATDDDGRFTVTAPLEVSQILQNLARRAVLLTADLDGGRGFFLTSIVAVDAETGQMWLDATPNAAQAEQVLSAAQLTCAGSLDKVQIQFSCSGMAPDECGGRPAFRVALPQSLSRLQRREHFRIQTPVVAPLKCLVTVVRDGRPARIELVVADISCGGVSLAIAPGQFEPAQGESYPCTIVLPGTGSVNTAIEAHHAHIQRGAHGKESTRCGFSFVNPAGPMVTAIQRYILNLERERRAKAAG
jgi:c-di-GMP-binding flagellar brake protein YcgR